MNESYGDLGAGMDIGIDTQELNEGTYGDIHSDETDGLLKDMNESLADNIMDQLESGEFVDLFEDIELGVGQQEISEFEGILSEANLTDLVSNIDLDEAEQESLIDNVLDQIDSEEFVDLFEDNVFSEGADTGLEQPDVYELDKMLEKVEMGDLGDNLVSADIESTRESEMSALDRMLLEAEWGDSDIGEDEAPVYVKVHKR